MATLYDRLKRYCSQNKLHIPNKHHRGAIGKQVIQIYISEKKKEAAIHRVLCNEPEGPVMVIDYPDTFVPVIDQFIADYRDSVRVEDPYAFTAIKTDPGNAGKRKRIPYRGNR